MDRLYDGSEEIKKESLRELAAQFDCDKLGFERFYDIFFEKFRDKDINIFEIGILRGSSIAMWHEYFTKAKIYGIDKEESLVRKYDERTDLRCINQNDKKALIDFVEEVGFQDIIIDDGSHISSDIIASFDALKDYINVGGYYCIEDILPNNKYVIDEFLNNIDKFKKVLEYCVLHNRMYVYFYILERI